MQALLEFAPLLAFIIAYYVGGLYSATAVLMAAMLVLLAVDFVLRRRIPPMHALSAVLVFVLGGATLLFHDKHFIQVKPTALFWLAGIAFLGSFWIGERTLTERLLNTALQDQIHVPQSVWRRLNALWVVFYGLLGGLNLALACLGAIPRSPRYCCDPPVSASGNTIRGNLLMLRHAVPVPPLRVHLLPTRSSAPPGPPPGACPR